jgi:hypothetical protein
LKKLTLDHSYTPSILNKINQDLVALTTEDDPDESKFLQLVTQRDEFIQDYIDSTPAQERNQFVTAELEVNVALVAYAEESFKASLKELSGFVRSRKAVKKYL